MADDEWRKRMLDIVGRIAFGIMLMGIVMGFVVYMILKLPIEH